jgi:hypothetical protein
MSDKRLSTGEKIELYNKFVATRANAVRKGDTVPYTSLNGHMYSYFSKDGFLALRLLQMRETNFSKNIKRLW